MIIITAQVNKKTSKPSLRLTDLSNSKTEGKNYKEFLFCYAATQGLLQAINNCNLRSFSFPEKSINKW